MFEFLKKLDLEAIGSVITLVNPVAGIVVKSIDAIVSSQNETVSNESVVRVLESMSKSKGNDLDISTVNALAETLKAIQANK